MEIAGLIISGIILLILILLFCPVVIKLTFNDEVSLRVGLLFPVFKVLPMKPQKEKQAKKKKPKKEKKKKPEDETKKKKPTLLEKVKSQGLSGIIELLEEVIDILKSVVKKITGHLVISKMDLELAIASEDAAKTAVTFGYACSAVFPLLSIIEHSVKKCRHRENIYPVFTETKTNVYFVMKARIMPFFILSAAFLALFRGGKTIAKL